LLVGRKEGGERTASQARLAKKKKSLRETFSPLKNLKTAKSGIFRVKGYQALSKTHDFAGETISFRFRFTWASFFAACHFGTGAAGRSAVFKNLENPRSS
jgi:hypothetical protein